MKNILTLLIFMLSVTLVSGQQYNKKAIMHKRGKSLVKVSVPATEKARYERSSRDTVSRSSNKTITGSQVIHNSEPVNSNTDNAGTGAKQAPGNMIINNPSGTINGTRPDVINGNGSGTAPKQPTP